MKLADLYECVEAIYRAGWNDALEGREFDPQIPDLHGDIAERADLLHSKWKNNGLGGTNE